MAVLPDVDRARLWRGLMRYWSNLREPIPLNKTDLRAAVNATDVWIDNNAAAYNTALPTPARTSLTATQKTLLFCIVALMRHLPAFVRNLLGEVD